MHHDHLDTVGSWMDPIALAKQHVMPHHEDFVLPVLFGLYLKQYILL